MSGHSEHEGRLVEGEGAELDPEMNHVMGQPGEAEDHHNHQYCLSSLNRKRGFFLFWGFKTLWFHKQGLAKLKPGLCPS